MFDNLLNEQFGQDKNGRLLQKHSENATREQSHKLS